MLIDGKEHLVPEERFLPPQPWEETTLEDDEFETDWLEWEPEEEEE